MPANKKILVIDDTLPMRVMIEEILSDAGYKVFTASDGMEGWQKLQLLAEDLDLMILDLLMPRMSGFEVLARLKEEYPNRKFPVLVISGVFKSEREINRIRELGANGFLNKMFLADEILYRVNSIFYEGGGSTRRYPRVLCSFPIDYKYNHSWHSSYTTTISLGGLFVRTLMPAPINTHLTLRVTVTDLKAQIAPQAVVVWVNSYDEIYRKKNSVPGMGLSFISLKEDERKILSQIIEQKLQEERKWSLKPTNQV